jgi:hypothetical protein
MMLVCFAAIAGDVNVHKISVPKISKKDSDKVDSYKKTRGFLSNLDPNQLNNDPNQISVEIVNYYRWWTVAMEKNYDALPMVPYDVSGLRLIAEIRTPWSEDEKKNQEAELSYFKSIGYNGALVVWQGENPTELLGVVKKLRQDKWTIWITYGPEESKEDTAYVDPSEFEKMTKMMISHCDAFLPCWRKSSNPHWDSNDLTKYPRVLSGIVRNERKDIPIIGEVFIRPDKTMHVAIPTGSSAALVLNVGFQGINTDGAFNIVRSATDLPLICLIVGPKPYYATIGSEGGPFSKEGVRQACKRLEERFVKSRFPGTVTLAGDGYGQRFYMNKLFSDSLTKTNWREGDK